MPDVDVQDRERLKIEDFVDFVKAAVEKEKHRKDETIAALVLERDLLSDQFDELGLFFQQELEKEKHRKDETIAAVAKKLRLQMKLKMRHAHKAKLLYQYKLSTVERFRRRYNVMQATHITLLKEGLNFMQTRGDMRKLLEEMASKSKLQSTIAGLQALLVEQEQEIRALRCKHVTFEEPTDTASLSKGKKKQK